MTRVLPRRADYAGFRGTWRADLLAGLTVAVVALPLALAFGVTSGVGAQAGLVTAVVAGLAAAVLGGSDVQVSGPTGAMTVVLVPIVSRYGADAAVVVALLGGGIVVALGLLRVGRAVAYAPWPVVEGFTVGIAVVIALQQVPAAVGTAKAPGERAVVVAWRTVARTQWQDAWPALLVATVVAALMIALPRLQRAFPASLVSIVVVTVAADALDLHIARIGALPASLPAPGWPHLSPGTVQALLPSAVAVAALAALESLLSARVADGMHDQLPGGRAYDPDRELVGQGAANVLSGLFGGLPATGAIARTAVNVRAGARSRLAAAAHAVVLAAIVYAGSGLVARIPLAALAGVLVVTAARMIAWRGVLALLRSTASDALVLVCTALATVVFDLVRAVEIGLVVAGVLALRQVARASGAVADSVPPELVAESDEHAWLRDRVAVYRVDGALFFGVAQRFLDELASVSDVEVVILRLSGVRVLDATAAHALAEIIDDLEKRHITVLLKGFRPEHRALLDTVRPAWAPACSSHVFDTLDEAVAHAATHRRGRPALAV